MGLPRAAIPRDYGRVATSHGLPTPHGPVLSDVAAQRLWGALFHGVTADPRGDGTRNVAFLLRVLGMANPCGRVAETLAPGRMPWVEGGGRKEKGGEGKWGEVASF